jgi:tetraacyldisaccharide 4'-kinase
MFFNFLKSFRILLLPFALLYWLAIWIRNGLYDKNILKSASFGLPLICVGNLSVGGTGKSPMVEYLVRLLKGRFNVATLSRGYKRKTKGYALANESTTALEIGDEPMQFHVKFPDVAVAVGEERLVAIPQLLHDKPATEVIILDDAFQHRSITAGLNILLTECDNLFTNDFYLPAGDLRDLKSQYKRADIIVVTKCDPQLAAVERETIIKAINPRKEQTVFFTSIIYGQIHHIINNNPFTLTEQTEVLLVTGIANPKPLQSWLEARSREYHLQPYLDHHIFSIDDLKQIRKRFESLQGEKIILTTEKDAVRLVKFSAEIKDWPLYVIPVRHGFLFDQEQQFNEHITNFIRDFKDKGKI